MDENFQARDLTSAFARLQSLLVGMRDVESFLQQMTVLATGVGGHDTSCGITMRYDHHPVTVASSDQRASALDESQYQAAEGPCLHTLNTGEIADIADTAALHSTWPEYVAKAREEGLRCSLSLPLTAQSQTVGAMNMYGFEGPGMFSGERRRPYELFAARASGSLWLAQVQQDESQTRSQVEQALASRTVIDQAIGVLMGQQRCTADEAFDLLRMASQRDHRKLRDVAVELVTRVSGAPPQQGRPFQ